MANPLPVSKAQHGSDHWRVGEHPPFFAVTRTEENARLIASIPCLQAEVYRLRMICQSAHDRLLRGQDDKTLLAMLEKAWTEKGGGDGGG